MIRVLSLELIGYKAIYNGLFKNSIFLDFSNFRNKITLLRGPSGIGKSTIEKSLSLLPETNNDFIDGAYAEKKFEFININTGTTYLVQFIHNIKSNGQRESVKAYLFKTEGYMDPVNLNPNGNLSSYKTVIENEFDIDLGFLIFSRITNEDKGLVEKTPAERRKCVNILLKNTDIYNEINKKSTALFNQYKGIINSITGKLNKIPDKPILVDLISKYEIDIKNKKEELNKYNIRYGELQGLIKGIDPDNAILDRYQIIENELSNINIDNIDINENISKLSEIKNNILNLENDNNNIQNNINIYSVKLDNLNKTKEEKNNLKINILSRIDKYKITSKDSLIDRKNILEESINNKKEIITSMGINDFSITSEDYLLCIRAIQNIENISQNFLSEYSSDIIDISIEYFLKNIKISSTDLYNRLTKINNNILDLDKKISDSINKENIVKVLDNRPSDCINDNCSFIKNALEIQKDLISSTIYINEKEVLISEMENIKFEIERKELINDAVLKLHEIKNIIIGNNVIFKKVKYISDSILLSSPNEFIKNIKNYNFTEINMIYSFIRDVNIIEEYKNNMNELNMINDQINEYLSKEEIINDSMNDLDNINKDLEKINDDIIKLNNDINNSQNSLKFNNHSILEFNKEAEQIEEIIFNIKNKEDLENEYNSIKDKIQIIKAYQSEMQNIVINSNILKSDIEPMENELNTMKTNLMSYDEYVKELELYNRDYEIISMIKKYSNPTGVGIQSIFMKYYMNSIIDSSNEFLQYFFNGEFELMHDNGENPNEFKIPCKGNGIIHDDISSMSFSQRCIVSMIISISLYRKSSNIYNLLLLDEIDSGLDSEQRRIFARNIDSISDMLGISHIIITSHNNEFNESYCDVIDLAQYK